ncbi:hypothetical protein HPB47_008559 [Ixodes persulcatus]|uniref:Uncharacterized protein n=1 Tax=Ixodes persulcatus TaxID=34615 RepID=A0AC60P4D8_IXOPE|nr:hypothetical protein HPB47_008559 [Ixodes persulcatus]
MTETLSREIIVYTREMVGTFFAQTELLARQPREAEPKARRRRNCANRPLAARGRLSAAVSRFVCGRAMCVIPGATRDGGAGFAAPRVCSDKLGAEVSDLGPCSLAEHSPYTVPEAPGSIGGPPPRSNLGRL